MPLGTSGEYCSVCFAPLEQGLDGRLLPCWCHKYWNYLDDILPITYLTHGNIRRIGNDIKYAKEQSERRHIPYIAGVLHRYLCNNLDAIEEVWAPTITTIVPSHPDKVSARGFDLLPEVINYHGGLRDRAGIREILAQLDPSEQPASGRRPLPEAWGLVPGADVRGSSVLIIDDVVTSGASLAGIGIMLRQHGARRVYGLVIARSVTPAGEQKIMAEMMQREYQWKDCKLRSQMQEAARHGSG